MPRSSLYDLYVEGLRDLYHAEGQLAKVLPRLANAAHAKELPGTLGRHLASTSARVARPPGRPARPGRGVGLVLRGPRGKGNPPQEPAGGRADRDRPDRGRL